MRRQWHVEEEGDTVFAITCGWCHTTARVKRSKWLTLRADFIGRSCTYCFATSAIPDRYLPHHLLRKVLRARALTLRNLPDES